MAYQEAGDDTRCPAETTHTAGLAVVRCWRSVTASRFLTAGDMRVIPGGRRIRVGVGCYTLEMRTFKVIVEKHVDGYVAYPLGVKGGVVGQGASYDEALADLTSALRFHAETFGVADLEADPEVIEAFVAEARVDVGAAVPG